MELVAPTNHPPLPPVALRVDLARVVLGRLHQLLPTLLPHDPQHAELHRALAATVQPLVNFLCYDECACGGAGGSHDGQAAVGPPTQALRRDGQVHVPAVCASDACRLVFSAVNDAVLQRTLRFLPAEGMAAVEQTSRFFRGTPVMPSLPALPPPPPSRVERAVRGAAKAAGLEGQIERLAGESWSKVLRFVQRPAVYQTSCAAGATHVLLVQPGGALFSFGDGEDGATGHGDEEQRLVPTRVAALARERVVCVAAGDQHSLVVVARGAVFSFGHGDNGRLGHNDSVSQRVPKLVEALAEERAVAVAAGDHYSMVLTVSAQVFTFGYGLNGRLGHGDAEDRLVPKLVAALAEEQAVAVAAGAAHSMVVTAGGRLYTFGWGRGGGLGQGNALNQLTPKLVEAFVGERVVAVSGGVYHSMAVTADGKAFSWGRDTNESGCMGHGNFDNELVPKQIVALAGQRVVAVAAGGRHSLMVTAGGKLYSCGHNSYGQLGHGDKEGRAVPTEVAGVEAVVASTAAACGLRSAQGFSLCTTRTGACFSWGRGHGGVLGHGNEADLAVPTQV